MYTLVINCGSSSLKFQLIDSNSEEVMAIGLCERIGIEESKVTYQKKGEEKSVLTLPVPTHKEAVKIMQKLLTDDQSGIIKSLKEVDAVGHRVAHGGEIFTSSALITEETIKAIEACSDMAPLHNPASLIGIRACKELMPDTPMAAVFDTSFHQTMPETSYLYGIPYEYYEKYKVRKYGFHGTSHSYVSKRAAQYLNRPYEDMRMVVCHLGNGSSITAVKNGKSMDTSMGFTPLEGLLMGTRSGDLDPGVMQFLMHKESLTIDGMLDVLNRKSGVLGISGVSSDFRDIVEASEHGSRRAKAALDSFTYRVAKYVGAYTAAMRGVDAIVFTAGVGENDGVMRKEICDHFSFLGVEIDPEANQVRGKEKRISTANSRVEVLVIPTNEELAIARETLLLVK